MLDSAIRQNMANNLGRPDPTTYSASPGPSDSIKNSSAELSSNASAPDEIARSNSVHTVPAGTEMEAQTTGADVAGAAGGGTTSGTTEIGGEIVSMAVTGGIRGDGYGAVVIGDKATTAAAVAAAAHDDNDAVVDRGPDVDKSDHVSDHAAGYDDGGPGDGYHEAGMAPADVGGRKVQAAVDAEKRLMVPEQGVAADDRTVQAGEGAVQAQGGSMAGGNDGGPDHAGHTSNAAADLGLGADADADVAVTDADFVPGESRVTGNEAPVIELDTNDAGGGAGVRREAEDAAVAAVDADAGAAVADCARVEEGLVFPGGADAETVNVEVVKDGVGEEEGEEVDGEGEGKGGGEGVETQAVITETVDVETTKI